MPILVFAESAEGKIKKTSLEAICYGAALGEVTAIAFGAIEKPDLEDLGKYGARKVLHVADQRLDHGVIQAYATVIAKAGHQCS